MICCVCKERPHNHTITKFAKTRYLCCTCYVREGNPPADWHEGCMKEVEGILETEGCVMLIGSCTKCGDSSCHIQDDLCPDCFNERQWKRDAAAKKEQIRIQREGVQTRQSTPSTSK